MSRGWILWLTGKPSSGKTSLARLIVDELDSRRMCRLWLDSDDIREVMTPQPTYRPRERDAVYATIGRVALRAQQGGVSVVVSATAPRRAHRDPVRQGAQRFVEAWLRCPDDVLDERDHRGLYRRYRLGEVRNVPGRDAPYEEPVDPELVLDSGSRGPEELSRQVLDALGDGGLLDGSIPSDDVGDGDDHQQADRQHPEEDAESHGP